ncbi:hypothetical protein BCR34DRAFT_80534 [Clohesyomyces aquaticus]|uniref:Secreted protein n=1 Tax=Clohesyomyces aquaticus TaxID=1231657 RepID=A0A1Y1YWZ5_9PLEO|nr:hypothetical protein BCR34DRAFT_80534 [Clohesyomyces aquaticus]
MNVTFCLLTSGWWLIFPSYLVTGRENVGVVDYVDADADADADVQSTQYRHLSLYLTGRYFLNLVESWRRVFMTGLVIHALCNHNGRRGLRLNVKRREHAMRDTSFTREAPIKLPR